MLLDLADQARCLYFALFCLCHIILCVILRLHAANKHLCLCSVFKMCWHVAQVLRYTCGIPADTTYQQTQTTP